MTNSKQLKSLLLPGLIVSTLVISGCGGGTSSNNSSSGNLNTSSSRGLITGFGSVYVNGVKYNTDTAKFDVDNDKTSTQSNLHVGQFVTITGSVDSNGKTGKASHISYVNELQGPIKNKTTDPLDLTGETGTIEVLGRLVTVDADTKIDNDVTFSSLVNNNFVEVSGFPTDTGLTATYIELQYDEKIEMLGQIEKLDVVPGTFKIHGFTIAYNSTTVLEDDITLADGLFVEVKGEIDPLDDSILIAAKIEAEDDGKGENNDEVELQGVVSNYDPNAMTFFLGSVKVDATNATKKPVSLDLGGSPAPKVEVEGHWLDGVLIAYEIKQKGQKVKINARLSAVGTDTITFTFNNLDIIVRVNQQTDLKDDINDNDLTLAGLSAGDYVEMEAFNDGSGDINAVELKRKTLDKVKIQAPVEAFNEATQSVTLLGISFDLSAVADYGDNTNATTFYGALASGVFIEIKDTAIGGDGVFDEAELED